MDAEVATPADGDVIVIPAGTCTWTGSVHARGSFTTSVTIRGAGAVYANAGGGSTSGSDQTVIIDNIGHSGGSGNVLELITIAGKSLRLTGIALLQNGSSSVSNEMIFISGPSTSVRVDHCHTYMQMGSYQLKFQDAYGVIDHNFFDGTGGWGGVSIHQPNTSGAGDEQWAQADQFGTANFVYVEDSQFNNSGIGDSQDGARFVYRYNTMLSTQSTGPQMAQHGLDASNGRSTRASEIYLNSIVSSFSGGQDQPTFSNNGGTMLFWGNTVTQYRSGIDVDYTRKNNGTYNYGTPPSNWGNCSATTGNGWDQNASAPSGYACMDQPGRGQGDLATGWLPAVCNSTLGCSTFNGQWLRQALSPIYVWGNAFTTASSHSGTLINNIAAAPLVTDNKDYYQQFGTGAEPGSFDGTAGIGQGLLSARSSTCAAGPGGNTPGVGYWATDTNVLYVCNPTDTWTAYYAPYTYPHPLASGGGAYAFLGSAQVASGDAFAVHTANVNTTGATAFWAVVSVPSGSADPVVSDSLTNSCWVFDNTHFASGLYVWVFKCANPSVSSSMSFTVAGTTPNATIMWFSGGASTLEGHPTGDSFNNSTWPMSTFTPASANELIILGAANASGTMSSIDSSFTLIPGSLFNGSYVSAAYRIETTLAAVSPIWTPASFSGGPALLVSYTEAGTSGSSAGGKLSVGGKSSTK